MSASRRAWVNTTSAVGSAVRLMNTGADTLAGMPTWREPEAVAELAHMVGVTRPGHEVGADVTVASLLEIPRLEVSSTGIRERVAMHHGEADIGPRIGGGYRVRVRLPLTVAAS